MGREGQPTATAQALQAIVAADCYEGIESFSMSLQCRASTQAGLVESGHTHPARYITIAKCTDW